LNALLDDKLTHPKKQADAFYRAESIGGVWRLVVNGSEGNLVDEEVVVSFQGILCKVDMPPFNEKNM
jgi:hypothetical protein